MLGHYCGSEPPPRPVIETPGGALLVKFVSDLSVPLTGFVASWHGNFFDETPYIVLCIYVGKVKYTRESKITSKLKQ